MECPNCNKELLEIISVDFPEHTDGCVREYRCCTCDNRFKTSEVVIGQEDLVE